MKEAECGHRGFSGHASKHITRRLLDMGQPGIGQKMARVCHNDLTRATEGRAKMSLYCQNFTRIKPFGCNNGPASLARAMSGGGPNCRPTPIISLE